MTTRFFARTAAMAAIALACAGAASADVFLKVGSAPGDATQRGFEDQIVLNGASVSVMNFVQPDPEGLAGSSHVTNVGNISLTKSPDRSSPKLMLAAVNGAPLGTIEITFTAPGKPGQGQQVESKWIIEGAEVRSFNVYPNGDTGLPPVETIEIAYGSMKYQHFTKDGKGGRSMEEVKWDVPAEQIFPGDGDCR
jgi:type VI secretion system Hcp family effector